MKHLGIALALIVAVFLAVGPAIASPKSGSNGKSESCPDQDGTGADKGANEPGCDKPDGNNGCGNDDDREDDNNGNCGKPAQPTPSPSHTSQPSPTPSYSPSPYPSLTEQPGVPSPSPTPTVGTTPSPVPSHVPSAKPTPKTDVPSPDPTSTPRAGRLPATGLSFWGWVLVALTLILVGEMLWRKSE